MTRRGCKNCCGGSGCNPVTLHPPNDWDGWTDPPDETVDGEIDANHATSIAYPRPTGNWVVDVTVTLGAALSIGTVVSVGDARFHLSKYWADATDYWIIDAATCTRLAASDGTYHLRVIENEAGEGYRSRRVELWTNAPTDGDFTNRAASIGYKFESEDEPTEVLIAIESGSESINVGNVTVSDTDYESSGCPVSSGALRTCNATTMPRYLVTQVRAVVSGIVPWTITRENYGEYKSGPNFGDPFCGPETVKQVATLDYTFLNGTYVYDLQYRNGSSFPWSTLTPAGVEIVLGRMRDGTAFCGSGQYQWSAPTISFTHPTPSVTDTAAPTCLYNGSPVVFSPPNASGSFNWKAGNRVPNPTYIMTAIGNNAALFTAGFRLGGPVVMLHPTDGVSEVVGAVRCDLPSESITQQLHGNDVRVDYSGADNTFSIWATFKDSWGTGPNHASAIHAGDPEFTSSGYYGEVPIATITLEADAIKLW